MEDWKDDEDTNPGLPKLKLPRPESVPLAPARVPAPSPRVPAPIPKKKLPLFRVQPERPGSGKIVLFVAGLTIAAVMTAFTLVPDGRTIGQMIRGEGEGSGELGDPSTRTVSSYQDRYRLAAPAPDPDPDPAPTPPLAAARPAVARVAATRHAHAEKPVPLEHQDRYGFERVEQPKRHYDNFDASQEQGNGIPMLMVFSKPAGMDVEVEGKLMGMSPLIRPLPKDTKRVKVRLSGAGFVPWEQTIEANRIEQFRVGVTMHRIAE